MRSRDQSGRGSLYLTVKAFYELEASPFWKETVREERACAAKIGGE
jgi:hypothetical protein